MEELFFNFQVDIMNIIFYAHGEKWRKGNEDKKMTYLDRFFHLTERNTSVRTEIIAGLTTFLSCVSIVVLNPSILSAAGMDIRASVSYTHLDVYKRQVWDCENAKL